MKRLLLIITLLSLAAALFAGIGGLPFETLGKGLGIREISMGEAGTANCAGANVVFWNPACLDSITKNEVYMSVETLFEGANYDQVSFVSPVSVYGGIGASVMLMNYPSYDRQDGNGASLGNEGSMRDVAGVFGYGKTLFWGIQAGLAAKIFVKSIDDAAYTSFNADISLFKPVNEILDVGLDFRNILPLTLKYTSETEKFTMSARQGLALKLFDKKLRLAVDAEEYFIAEPKIFVYGGAEYCFGNMFFIRAGINTTGDMGGGLGISWQDITFDYGASLTEYALSHKFALSYRFGGYDLSLKAEPEIFSPIGGNRKAYIRINAKMKYTIYKWRIEITDGMGDVVKSWNGSGDPDTEVIWDGLKPDGMPMKEGEFRAVLTVIDENDVSAVSDPIKIKISNNDTFNIPLQGD
jgi:hypothetical protein